MEELHQLTRWTQLFSEVVEVTFRCFGLQWGTLRYPAIFNDFEFSFPIARGFLVFYR